MKQTKKLSRKVISYVLALTMVLSAFTGLVPGMRLTAYAADTYTVSFNGNQGSGSMNPVTATIGQAMPKVNPAFSRTGYSFAGFYDAANGGTQYYNNSGQSARNWDKTANTTLYAHWTANKYTVTLNQQGGTAGSGSTTATYAAAMPTITPPQKTGYTFGGYFTETNGNGGKYYNANGTSAKNWDKTSNTTLYAYWTAKTYTVTLSDGDGTGGSGTLTATYDANLPTAAIPTKSNYAFAGYYDQENGAGTQYINDQGQGCKTWDKDGNTTLYAHYTSTVDKTALNTGITAAETLYNSIKDNTDYTDIASTRQTAINTAKGVADSDEVNQEAVDAATTTITTAKTTAVVGMINKLPVASDVTTSDKTTIEAVRAAYASLSETEQGKVDANTLKKLTDAEEALGAAEVKSAIENLPAANQVASTDESAITAARTAYDKLSDPQKTAVGTDALAKLEACEVALAIADLPEVGSATSADKTDVEAARAAFDKLTDAQKTQVGDAAKAKLEAVEAAVAIAGLPVANEVSTNDKDAIEAARKAFDKLNDAQKEQLGANAKAKLEAVEAALAIAELPSAGSVTTADQEAIEAARAAYDKLSDDQKTQVGNEFKEKLENAEVALVEKIIEALPEEVKTSDKDAIEAARAAYDKLNENQKSSVGDVVNKLENAEAALKAAQEAEKKAADAKAADAVKDAINKLPANPGVDDADKVKAAREAFDKLTDDQKKLIDPETVKKLEDAEKAVAAAEKAAKEAADKADADAAAKVTKKINALPKKPAMKDEKNIKAARKAYNALTAEQKKLVKPETVKKLKDAEKALKKADKKAKKIKNVTINKKTASKKTIHSQVVKLGASKKYIKSITLGKKVKKIKPMAFKTYKKAKTLVIKTKKLTKKSVKAALKNSKIKKIKVKVGSKKMNKKFVKKYKKFFTKKNAGKKVKVV